MRDFPYDGVSGRMFRNGLTIRDFLHKITDIYVGDEKNK